MTNNKTVSEHLAFARSQRDAAKLRKRAKEIASLPKKNPKPCDCGRTDGTHSGKCPVYKREYRKRNQAPSQS
jgi:hypothetical protein